MDIDIDLGRPLLILCGFYMMEQINGLIFDFSSTQSAVESDQRIVATSRESLLLGNVGISTSEISVELEGYPHEENPKAMVSFFSLKARANLNPAEKGK